MNPEKLIVKGTMAAVDRARRAVLDAYEIPVPLPDAMVAMVRPPDYRDAAVVAWGSVTRAEARALNVYGEDERLRSAFNDEIDEFFAAPDTVCVTLYYRDQSTPLPESSG